MLNWALSKIGAGLARYLDQPAGQYRAFSVAPLGVLQSTLRPGDVLLVEGDKRVSVAIKYLTQSTWSHAAFYVGDALEGSAGDDPPGSLIEADLQNGVIAVPIAKYAEMNTRICRPVGLVEEDLRRVVQYVIDRIGLQYDLKNIIDLMRYLFPTPPVPTTWRRRMIALGSGDPTRAICSTLIAQAFQSVRYPILPTVHHEETVGRGHNQVAREILQIRHHSLFTPRDFDLSPYFGVVKPTVESGFDYRQLVWHDDKTE